MDIKYETFLNMSWREFDYKSTGYLRRIERGWDYNRHLIAGMYNSSGMSKKKITANDIMQLKHLDRPEQFRKVKRETIDRMLKHLENG